MNLTFALEYSLGHITHAQNLKHTLESDPSVHPTYIDLPYDGMPGRWAKLPGVRSNWSLRASLGAYLGFRRHVAATDAALFHTQVTSLLSAGLMRRVPSVISLDATPLQYDALGAFYGHRPSSSARIEGFKKRLNERAFRRARHFVTWSQWAKDSLVAEYGVTADKVTVIPPGIDTARWNFPPRDTTSMGRPVNLLFVGGDFPRKGGDALLQAFQLLPPAQAHLHIVTKTEGVGDNIKNITVHRNVAPNSEHLLGLFREADLFVFPTRGDCLPLAVMEALASGLPVITTDVGALSEAVTHGQTGLVVPMDNSEALANAIQSLVSDGPLRARLGKNAREAGLERFDAVTNYRKLIHVVKQVAK